jgi:hypothetical protein
LGTNPFLAPRSAEWQKAAAERLVSLKTASCPKSPGQTPMSARAQVLEAERLPEQAPS